VVVSRKREINAKKERSVKMFCDGTRIPLLPLFLALCFAPKDMTGKPMPFYHDLMDFRHELNSSPVLALRALYGSPSYPLLLPLPPGNVPFFATLRARVSARNAIVL
jgi:hypothetical protein